jgi:hypothetical protein
LGPTVATASCEMDQRTMLANTTKLPIVSSPSELTKTVSPHETVHPSGAMTERHGVSRHSDEVSPGSMTARRSAPRELFERESRRRAVSISSKVQISSYLSFFSQPWLIILYDFSGMVRSAGLYAQSSKSEVTIRCYPFQVRLNPVRLIRIALLYQAFSAHTWRTSRVYG